MKICVLTNPGSRGEREPRAFQLGARRVPIAAILERWQAPSRRYYRVRDVDGRRFVLRQDRESGSWELEAVYGPAEEGQRRAAR